MNSQEFKKYKLPDKSGVYFFLENREVLYIGKATSLKDRVKSYFAGDLGETPAFAEGSGVAKRGPKIWRMVELANRIEWQETDSVLEALLLETELIKKYQPPYNTREKDDKSYWYVIITNEDFPRILPIRGLELESLKNPYFSKSNFEKPAKLGIKIKDQFGPFPYGAEIKEALKIVRRIFPYRDKCLPCGASVKQDAPRGETSGSLEDSPLGAKSRNRCRACFNRQIGLCPGVCTGEISKTDYRKIVRNIKLFFEGKKKEVLKNLGQEMKKLAKKQEFEKAGRIRNQIFALNHIRDVALLKNKQGVVRSRISGSLEKRLLTTELYRTASPTSIRIEAYDIAHLSGKATVGAMVVWQDGEMQKNEYRKFKLKGPKASQSNDLANLREILKRRFNHPEWPLPDIIVVDGNQVQSEVAREVGRSRTSRSQVRLRTTDGGRVAFLTPQIIAVTKDAKHQASKILGDRAIIHDYHRAIIETNAEAHRFAIDYHRKIMRQIV